MATSPRRGEHKDLTHKYAKKGHKSFCTSYMGGNVFYIQLKGLDWIDQQQQKYTDIN